ncbi:MAG: HPr kinase/phosphatase C-terminal domain-containing protein [Pseudomonadota bacterium]
MQSVGHEIVHGTCVALGPCAALLRGKSGSGKSDLALRFLALPPSEDGGLSLVADDQVCLRMDEEGLIAGPPENLAGLMEVRGLGIQSFPFVDSARLVLVCDLVAALDVPRMPPDPWACATIAGTTLPVIKLAPFEASAPLKLKLAIVAATAHLRAANNKV